MRRSIYCLLLLVAVLTGCATNSSMKTSSNKWAQKQFASSKLPKFDIPIEVNDRVVAWIDYFQGPGKKHFARYLARSGRYQVLMETVLRKYALPQDLIYVAMIESGFSSKAYSRAHASGFWQFIRGTGKRYDLDINSWVDERRDPVKSTVAAARYLRDLYDEFGNWYLAMAGYNAGEGKIRKAIKRNGTRNFWELIERDRGYLRAETKDYVPKFIAAAIMAKSPERFGFGDVVYDAPLEFETASVDSPTDLEVIARCANVPLDVITELNPELVRGATHSSNYELRLPIGSRGKFEVAYASVPPSERMMIARHIVKRNETAGRIARHYGVSVRELLAANDMTMSSQVKKGQSLVIPTGGAAKKRVKEIVVAEETPSHGKAAKHRVQQGETLGLIAQNYGVNISSIKKWNKLKRNLIRTGQVLKIYGAEESEVSAIDNKVSRPKGEMAVTVKRGDSWWKVAQKYGVSINELKGWNPSIASKDLVAGHKIKLFAKGSAEPAAATTTVAVNMSVSDRIDAANLSPSNEFPVQTIAVATIPKPESTISYKIKNGDTLWDIAQKYKISVKDIQEWNNFANKSHKRLQPGDIITLKLAGN